MSEKPLENPEDGTFNKRPDSVAYNVKESRDGTTYWNRVGVAWKHQDGNGSTVKLDSIPVDGWLTLRDIRDERMQSYQDERQAKGHDQQQHEQGQDHGHGRDR